MGTRTIPLSALGQQLIGMHQELIPALGVSILRVAAEELFMDASRRSPVGSVSTSRHPGKYAASHRLSAGSPRYADLGDQTAFPRLGVTDAASALAELSLDQIVWLTNDAASDGNDQSYAPVLEAGRHVDSLGRMAGSLQAPDGIYGPAIEALGSRGAQLMDRAINNTLRAMGY